MPAWSPPPILLLPAAMLCVVLSSLAAETESPAGIPLDISADRMEYSADRQRLIAIGQVVVRHDDAVLKADRIIANRDTGIAVAEGNVTFVRGSYEWEGRRLVYNLDTGEGEFGEFRGYFDPYYVRSQDFKRVGEGHYELTNALITTCGGDQERPEVFVTARRAEVIDGEKIRARGVVMRAGPVPFMYLPFASYNLKRKTNLDVLPGHASRWGAFLLTAYNYRPTDHLRAATRLDYRTARGFGYGQDLRWVNPQRTMHGELNLYYADDKDPYYKKSEAEAAERDLDGDRYRIRLRHYHRLSDRDILQADVGYLSDIDVLRDFFRRDHRHSHEPETRVGYTHRGDDFTAGVLLDKRLNDFYGKVDRMPEVVFDVRQRQLGDRPVYYRSRSSAAGLQRLFPAGSDEEDYDAFRIDSDHRLSYVGRYGGFLNWIPRIGYRGTYYDETLEMVKVDDMFTETSTNIVNGVTNIVTNFVYETSYERQPAGSDIRNLFELGLGTSFKAFRVFREPVNDEGGLRHVAEPFTDYSLIPEPNLLPEDLYQFDGVDRLVDDHRLRLGMRNKFQVKRRGGIRDRVDLLTYTDWRIEPREGQEDFSDLVLDLRVWPADWIRFQADGNYDWYQSEFPVFNLRSWVHGPARSHVSLEYRYHREWNDTLTVHSYLFQDRPWSIGSYWRYDVDGGGMREQAYYLQHRTDCVGIGLGYSGRGHDWDISVRVWLLAFPHATLGPGMEFW